MAKKKIDFIESKKEELRYLHIQRAIYKTILFDKKINELKELINKSEYGSFNNTLTIKKSFSYKELVSLKNIKYNKKNK